MPLPTLQNFVGLPSWPSWVLSQLSHGGQPGYAVTNGSSCQATSNNHAQSGREAVAPVRFVAVASKQSIEALINRTRTMSVVLENHARVDPLVAEAKAWNWNQFRPSVLRRRVMSALPKSRNPKLFPQQRSVSISC